MNIKISFSRGFNGLLEPSEITMDDGPVRIEKVLDRWYVRDHRYLKVRTELGNTHLLRQHDTSVAWELVN